ncbi:hypothetical protein GGR53DRAFT_527485 [Hypoxylon sp. FL1150]|nr:hypothetical protein GGR53DRAFT_527485 [Hypoxylon sp. FL1150]
MVGIPKSNRCEFCRWRKTKCDEAWPTCGSCRKAGKECSGPANLVKFINNGRHFREDRDHGTVVREASNTSLPNEASDSRPTMCLLNIRNRTTSSGATFSKLRIFTQKPTVPSRVPSSPADLLAGKVASCLKCSEGTGYSLSMFLCTLEYASPLLQSNEALFDATNLLLSTWQKLRRGIRSEDLFDLASYSRALRSLQKFLFDRAENAQHISHSNGIYTLIMARGPPKLGDNLGCYLILDSFAFLFRLLLLGDIDNFFVRPEWQNALNSLFSHHKGKEPVVMEISKLVVYATMVAEATKRFSKVRNTAPELQGAHDLEEVTALIDDVDSKFRDLDESTLSPLLQANKIYEEEDLESPLGTSYDFPSPIMALCFANIGAFRIVINRLQQELNAIRYIDDPDLEAECMEWCTRIWKTCRYSQTLKPLCSVSFNSPICVSYITAPPAVRSYLLDTLKGSITTSKYINPTFGSLNSDFKVAYCGMRRG